MAAPIGRGRVRDGRVGAGCGLRVGAARFGELVVGLHPPASWLRGSRDAAAAQQAVGGPEQVRRAHTLAGEPPHAAARSPERATRPVPPETQGPEHTATCRICCLPSRLHEPKLKSFFFSFWLKNIDWEV